MGKIKQIIKIGRETNEIENRIIADKINETKICLFEKIEKNK